MALHVEHITKAFGEKTAVDDLSFSMEHSGVFGLIGTNGAGKTTTIRIILGIMKSDAGRAFCYAVVGLGIACAVLILFSRAYVSVSTAEVNAFTAIFGAVGASVGAAILPARVTFAREFADETVGCVRLSQRTAAAALLLDLQDKEWEVPEHVREQAKRLEKRSKVSPAAATDPASRKDEE